MRTLLVKAVSTILLVATALVAFTLPTKPALACSGTEDPVQVSQLIVGGRVSSWERTDRDEPPETFETIRVHFEVDEIYKGAAPPFPGYFLEGASLLAHFSPGMVRWAGAAGACGVFDEDPTGEHFILGLTWDERGFWRPNRLQVFHVGEPVGPDYDTARDRLLSRLGITAPAVGTGLARDDSAPSRHIVPLVTGLAFLGAAFGACWCRRSTQLGRTAPQPPHWGEHPSD